MIHYKGDIPLVSAQILTYKNFKYLFETLNSLLAQDYPRIEIYISDDGSNDFPKNEIEQYINANKKQNIKSVTITGNKANVGTVRHFNQVISHLKGKYIVGIAQDDQYFDNSVISNVVNEFEIHNYDIITGYRQVYDESLTVFKYKLPIDDHVKYFNYSPLKLYKILCNENFLSGACTYYSKSFFYKYGLFDERYKCLEDYPKYLSVTRQNVQIGFLDKPFIKYRLGGISTKGKSEIMNMDYLKLYELEILPYLHMHSKTDAKRFKKTYSVMLCSVQLSQNKYNMVKQILFIFYNKMHFIRYIYHKINKLLSRCL